MKIQDMAERGAADGHGAIDCWCEEDECRVTPTHVVLFGCVPVFLCKEHYREYLRTRNQVADTNQEWTRRQVVV